MSSLCRCWFLKWQDYLGPSVKMTYYSRLERLTVILLYSRINDLIINTWSSWFRLDSITYREAFSFFKIFQCDLIFKDPIFNINISDAKNICKKHANVFANITRIILQNFNPVSWFKYNNTNREILSFIFLFALWK